MTKEEIKQRGIGGEFWQHQDKARNWIANKVVASPRECKWGVPDPDDLDRIVLFINAEIDHHDGKRIINSINQGEAKGFY